MRIGQGGIQLFTADVDDCVVTDEDVCYVFCVFELEVKFVLDEVVNIAPALVELGVSDFADMNEAEDVSDDPYVNDECE
ncbi:MAG: hypothetical protein EZS28_031019 [Streblomastix strix]|uniref:Uncharacterized protein n=1 Tax=Streblomastix strix TaxID=222440 RepID=A0A5J4US03_9EUKA|nr:MAG: hypothetical protein EZS28_031019 [Streblomastix strix]